MTSIGEYYYLKNKKLEAQFQESESKRAADENELNRKMRSIYYKVLEKKNPDVRPTLHYIIYLLFCSHLTD